MSEKQIQRYLRESFARLADGLQQRFSGRAEGEDAVQEALVRAWQRSAAGERITSWDGWIAVTATNLARMQWRSRDAEDRALKRLALTAPDSWPEELRHLGPVADAIEELPRRQREILVMHYYGDLEVAEIARLLDISPGTVKSALHRARLALARSLRPQDDFGRITVKSWHMAGSHPGEYAFSRLGGVEHEGRPVVSLRCTAARPSQGFGTMMQTFKADDYHGKRMRLSCVLQTIAVADRIGLWMRVDGGGTHRAPLAFDNMQDRPINGTTGWRRVEVVLDIDPEASAIAFGVLLIGRGEGRIAGMTFEEVTADVSVTGEYRGGDLPPAPANLDFGELEEVVPPTSMRA